MNTFGKRLRDCRKEKGFSQSELAKNLNTNHSVIGKYERDEVKPSIDVVRKLANLLETTIAYLLGESEDNELFKDTEMLKRLKDINNLPKNDRYCILYTIDGLLRDAKARQTYAVK